MSSMATLVSTGVLMGIIHVLTGPDHLAAVATLSGADLASRRHGNLDGLLVGFRWGLGHSLGILVVGSALIAAGGDSGGDGGLGMDDAASATLEGLVGAALLGLGSWGVRRARRNRAAGKGTAGAGGGPGAAPAGAAELVTQMAEALNRDGDAMRGEGEGGGDDVDARIRRAAASLALNSSRHSSAAQGSRRSNMASIVERGGSDESDASDSEEDRFLATATGPAKGALSSSFLHVLRNEPPPMMASNLVHKHAAPENSLAVQAAARRDAGPRRCTPGLLALAVGLLHGAAGPAGVLGVVPAARLRDPAAAAAYLGAFCLASTLAMAGFGTCCAACADRLAGAGGGSARGRRRRAWRVEGGAALLSAATGLAWLALLATGRLEQAFPS